MRHFGESVSACGLKLSDGSVKHVPLDHVTIIWWSVNCYFCECTQEYKDAMNQFSLLDYRLNPPVFDWREIMRDAVHRTLLKPKPFVYVDGA